jgi:transcriptional regulator GlxA family with amidase domain|nr:helix-turn-helix domain-containing protein [Trinickia diaoshuihuensis]
MMMEKIEKNSGIRQTVGPTGITGDEANPRCKQIGLLLFKGFSFMTAGMVAEVFDVANELGGSGGEKTNLYSVRLLSIDGGDVVCSSSARVSTDRLEARHLGDLHNLIIIGDAGAALAARDNPFVRWLRVIYQRTDRIEPIVSQAALASIDAHRQRKLGGTDSWNAALEPRGAAEYVPSASDDQHRLLCLALFQVKRDLGLDVAMKIAERLMPGTSRVLLPKLSRTSHRSTSEQVRESARWLLANCEQDITIVDAASVAAMSQRNYLRHFKREMGTTPSEFLLQARLELTRRLLAETKLPVDVIARHSGMRNGDNLAKMFRKRLTVSPTEYRLRHARATV